MIKLHFVLGHLLPENLLKLNIKKMHNNQAQGYQYCLFVGEITTKKIYDIKSMKHITPKHKAGKSSFGLFSAANNQDKF